ncbi:MAG: endonuclease MutS2, partial [Candidatus Coatesbacteria bacterium]|nr:endonuclease MutS2 [Candidatus Coatesbacteria bacterium]
MDSKTLRLLEFPKMIDYASSLAETEKGQKAVEVLLPQSDRLIVENLLEETAEGVELLGTIAMPLSGVELIDDAITRSRITGSILQSESLLRVSETLKACHRLKNRFSKMSAALIRLRRKVSILVGFPEISEAVDHAISPSGEIKDNASPELRRIRIKINATQKKIKDKLDSVLRSREGVIAAQEQYITVRDGRYVVPVRSERRAALPGVIHDQSASGATVFIEPQETIELNNQVRQLQIEEEREIERILRELTAMVGEVADDIARNIELLAQIDCILARARFSSLLDARMPQIADDDRLVLSQARHPLLILTQSTRKNPYPSDSSEAEIDEKQLTSTELSQRFLSKQRAEDQEANSPRKAVIPIDISVGGGYRTLVITGPNTGGKTVALKTTGLLTLLALSGFHIPAQEGSSVPLYDQVFADIGDEQGIEQSLSTFSSHLSQIVSIIKGLTPRSLVLLDEIGAGTDPSEGSALAVAVLRHITDSGAHTVATTHHNSIKIFAHSTEGVRNASVQFDGVSLSPTYKLVIGLPGASNAFEIAKRLGLPQELIESARSSLSVESRRVSELLAFLDKEKSAVQAQSAELSKRTRETSAMQAELEKSIDYARERSQQIVEAAKREAKELTHKAKTELKSIMASIRAKKSADSLAKADIDRARTRLDAVGKEIEGKAKSKAKAAADGEQGLTPETIHKGMLVRMAGIDVEGEVIEVYPSKNVAEVAFGGIKVRSRIQSLIRVTTQPRRRDPERVVQPAFATGTKRPPGELMLIGMTREEALEALDLYLDQANLWGLREVRIVHGHGKGVLRA